MDFAEKVKVRIDYCSDTFNSLVDFATAIRRRVPANLDVFQFLGGFCRRNYLRVLAPSSLAFNSLVDFALQAAEKSSR